MPVTVVGPDHRSYSFPDGTTHDQAVAYFKKNAKPSAHDIKATPSIFSKEGAKSAMYELADKGTNLLPAAGGILGGTLGFGAGSVEPGGGNAVGATLGAGIGSGGGEAAKQILRRKIFNQGPQTSGEAAKGIGIESVLGAASEGGGQLASKPLRMAAEAMRPAAAAEDAAKAGTGFRMLPGQASGSPGMRAVEGAVGHLPGGIGTMEKFQEAQNKEMLSYLDKQLESISASGLKPEEAGNAVKLALKGTRAQLEESAKASVQLVKHQQQELYQSVQEMVRRDALSNPERLTKEEWAKILGPYVENEALDKAVAKAGTPETKAALKKANDFFRESKQNLKLMPAVQKQNLERAIVGKLSNAKPELMHEYFTKLSLEELRTMNRIVPAEERAGVARKIYEGMIKDAGDPQTKMLNSKKMASAMKELGDEKGKLIFGKEVWGNLQEVQKLLDRVPPSSGGAGGFHMKRTILGMGALPATILLSGHPLVAAGSVPAEMGTIKMVAEALTNPKTSTKVLNWLRMLTVGAGRAAHAGVSAAMSDNAPARRSDNSTSETMQIFNPKGLLQAGNINIRNRPRIDNGDGTHSSEYSVSMADEKGREILVPTVVNGKFLTPDGKKPRQGSSEEKAMFRRAWQHYQNTGEQLGIFDNSDDADAYANALHNRGN